MMNKLIGILLLCGLSACATTDPMKTRNWDNPNQWDYQGPTQYQWDQMSSQQKVESCHQMRNCIYSSTCMQGWSEERKYVYIQDYQRLCGPPNP